MEADAVPLIKILSSNTQMVIPIFQREYSWQEEQVKTLWDDIIRLYENIEQGKNKNLRHFLGPIVKAHITKSSVDTQKYHLIDGQQRITTLLILLAVMRNKFKITNNPVAKKIESNYLMNFGEDDDNLFKLLPSEGDRENFKSIMKGEKFPTKSKLNDTLSFFTFKLDEAENHVNFEVLRDIVVNNLILVNIDVGEHENPYLIFESLNATGTPLTQADLIRNYIFMKIPEESKQKELYRLYWRPMETALGDYLKDFFWQYSKIEGSFVKRERTYNNMKMELEPLDWESVEKKLLLLNTYAKFYHNLIAPENEKNANISMRLARHKRWDMSTELPFLLNIYRDYSERKITEEHFCKILDIIESFVVRRFLSRQPTNKLNLLFIQIYRKLDPSDIVGSLEKILKKDWPDDKQFIDGFFNYPIYTSSSDRTKMILESIEDQYQHKERVTYGSLEVEHILPQEHGDPEKLNEPWKMMLGPDYAAIHTKYVHTMGNLTLTGYNPEASDKSFSEKKIIYRDSHLEINKYFNQLNQWNEDEIIKRGTSLAEIAVDIWKYPKIPEKTLKSFEAFHSKSDTKVETTLRDGNRDFPLKNAYYINLGENKIWAESSIREGKIRIGWKTTPLNDIQEKKWDKIQDDIQIEFAEKRKQQNRTRGNDTSNNLSDERKNGAATRDFKMLYTIANSSSGDIWTCTYNSKFWWCEIKDGEMKEDEISKFREVSRQWSDKTLLGSEIFVNQLPDELKRTVKYSATLCKIDSIASLQRLLTNYIEIKKNDI
jgi:uncharacterized protein with ParB-like and HNH nuclease domain